MITHFRNLLIVLFSLWPGALFPAVFSVTNVLDSGPGSLREAITLANATPGADVIEFNIPGAGVHTISLLSALPGISDPVTIDGSTATGYIGQPLIEINGGGIVLQVLLVSAGGTDTRLHALVINGGATYGILVQADRFEITGCFVGTDPGGTFAVPNGTDGIRIQSGVSATIGGDLPGEGNLISGNGSAGAWVFPGANGAVVAGNLIGTDITGTLAVPNGVVGFQCNGHDLILGGTGVSGRNIISGNNGPGVNLIGRKAWVRNNYIGTDISGMNALGNTGVGLIFSRDSTTIGGSLPGEENVISGNGASGLGISASSSFGSRVIGNLIGTNASGTAAIPNGGAGIVGNGGITQVVIGGTTVAERNIISGNNLSGITLNTGSNNMILGNYIGTDITGSIALGNAAGGIGFNVATNNMVGDGTPAGANIISGNGGHGIFFNGTSNGNTLRGNIIGTDPSGLMNLGNTSSGVYINGGASNNQIGGLVPGQENLIAFSGQYGVLVNFSGSIQNSILRNSIFDHTLAGIFLSTGGNTSQPAPVLTGYANAPGLLTLFGSFNDDPNTTYRLEFFSSSTLNQGKTFLGSTTITTDGAGAYTLNETLPVTISGTEPIVTATATDPAGNTSAFGSEVVLQSGFLALSLAPLSRYAVQLSWQTSLTHETAIWQIEHRTATSGFDAIATLSSYRTQDEARFWEFSVNDLSPGRHYFRVTGRDLDGRQRTSAVRQYDVAAPDGISARLIQDVDGQLTWWLESAEQRRVSVVLYGLNGQLIGQLFDGELPANSVYAIPVSQQVACPPGLYLLELTSDKGKQRQKILLR